MAKDEDIPLFDLLERETDPELRRVLEHYRGAEIELQCAAELLGKTKRARWEVAALSYARDVAFQAQRYMAIERARLHKLSDLREDADTNPVGFPAWRNAGAKPLRPTLFEQKPVRMPRPPKPPLVVKHTGIPPLPAGLPAGFIIPREPSIIVDLDDLLPADVVATDEALFDTERPPPRPIDRYMLWTINLALTAVIVFTLWLLRREVTVP